MGTLDSYHPANMAVKFIALVVLIFSIKCEAKEETENSLDRLLSADCENSEPFFIKNEKKRKSYLTADPGTGAVKDGQRRGKRASSGCGAIVMRRSTSSTSPPEAA